MPPLVAIKSRSFESQVSIFLTRKYFWLTIGPWNGSLLKTRVVLLNIVTAFPCLECRLRFSVVPTLLNHMTRFHSAPHASIIAENTLHLPSATEVHEYESDNNRVFDQIDSFQPTLVMLQTVHTVFRDIYKFNDDYKHGIANIFFERTTLSISFNRLGR